MAAPHYVLSGLIVCLGALTVPALAQASKPEFIQKYESEGVPAPSRTFEYDESVGMPLPKASKATDGQLTVKAQPPTEKERMAFSAALKAAGSSKELADKLGNDSRLLSGGELPKAKSAPDSAPSEYKFTYYNYKKDQAIEAYVSKGKITKIRERELGYQPVVSARELQEAAAILNKTSPAFMRDLNVESLRGLAQSGPNGRREIHVFTDSGQPKSAVVDLRDKKVLDVK